MGRRPSNEVRRRRRQRRRHAESLFPELKSRLEFHQIQAKSTRSTWVFFNTRRPGKWSRVATFWPSTYRLKRRRTGQTENCSSISKLFTTLVHDNLQLDIEFLERVGRPGGIESESAAWSPVYTDATAADLVRALGPDHFLRLAAEIRRLSAGELRALARRFGR